MAVANFVLG